MRRNFAALLLLGAAWLGLAPAAVAQGGAVIQGTVKDADGNALPQATVAAAGVSTATRPDGTYRLELAGASGTVTVTARLIGYKAGTQSVTLGAAAATADFTLARDPLSLNEIVVTGVVQQGTKLESSVSVTTLDLGLVQQSSPRSTAEIFRTIPGVRAEASAGEGNTNITVRGVPISAGGSKYLQLQEDGLPVFLYGDIAFATADQFLRADNSVGRIEAIRGGSASTLSSNSPAGIINLISKTGDVAGGSIGYTTGVDMRLSRLDFDYGAPLGGGWNAFVGGFMRSGEGPRAAGYTAMRGGQVKANLTKTFDRGYARVHLKYLDDRTPAIMPMPIQVTGTNANPTWGSAPNFDIVRGGLQSVFLQSNFGLDQFGAGRASDVTDGMRSLSRSIGAEFKFDLGDNWAVEARGRMAQNSGRFVAPFSAGVGTPAAMLAGIGTSIGRNLAGATLRNTVTNSAFTGSLVNVVTMFDTELENFDNTIVDAKVSKTMNNVVFTAGTMRAAQRINMSWLWNNYLLDVDGTNAAPLDIVTAGGTNISRSGQYAYGVPAFGNCCQVRFNSTYDIAAPYAALAYKKNKLSLDGSVRWDIVRVTGVGFGGRQAEDVDVNNDGIIQPIEENVSVVDPSIRNAVDYTYDYPSFSAGANYVTKDDQAIFARLSLGASGKADRAIFPTNSYVAPINFGPKDRILQAEAGLKQSFRNGGLFLTGFYAKTQEEGGFEATTQQIIQNDYRAFGAELEASFVFGNLDLRGSATYTNARITSGDNEGNTPRRTPSFLGSVIPSYHFGDHVVGVSVIGQTSAPAQDVNQLVMPAYVYANPFVGFSLKNGLRLSLGVNNLFNSIGITESEEGSITDGATNFVRARSIAGRSITTSVGFAF